MRENIFRHAQSNDNLVKYENEEITIMNLATKTSEEWNVEFTVKFSQLRRDSVSNFGSTPISETVGSHLKSSPETAASVLNKLKLSVQHGSVTRT